MDKNELFWNAEIQNLKKGYTYDDSNHHYICLLCGYHLEDGIIHTHNQQLITSEKRMVYHVEEEHGGVFNYLLSLNKKYTGLTDNQKDVLSCFYNNMSDQETAKKLGISDSTIRNYRFKLREKEKQAKVITALMDLVNDHYSKGSPLVEPHKTATMIDDRYTITEEESQKVIQRYFTEEGRLKELPAKEKRKIVILREIAKNFETGIQYREVEINRVLKRLYDDHVILRRYLIQYGFLDRKKDCSYYWVK